MWIFLSFPYMYYNPYNHRGYISNKGLGRWENLPRKKKQNIKILDGSSHCFFQKWGILSAVSLSDDGLDSSEPSSDLLCSLLKLQGQETLW